MLTVRTISLSFLLLAAKLHAQFLPLNETGRCERSEVIAIDSISRPVLFTNEFAWARGLTRDEGKLIDATRDSLGGKVSGIFECLLYSQTGVFRKVSGAVTYRFQVEAKDGKYRYSFSDFVFHYFRQDRNYKMVQTGLTKPFEETVASGWQKIWNQHRTTVATLVSNQISDLKSKMKELPRASTAKEPEKKVDW